MNYIVEWENDKCLELIDAYAEHKLLWDPNHGGYYSKARKHKAWENVARKLNVEVNEAKRKISSLLASFRREKGKGRKSIAEGGSDSKYVSRWFAFERMQFLLDRTDSARSGFMPNGFLEDSLTDNIDDEITNKPETAENHSQVTTIPQNKPPPPLALINPHPKRRLRYQDYPTSNKRSKSSSAEFDSENEFDLFCKSLAVQLRRMPLDRALLCQQKLQSVMTNERLYQLNDIPDCDYNVNYNDIIITSPEGLSHTSYPSPCASPVQQLQNPIKTSPTSFTGQDDDLF